MEVEDEKEMNNKSKIIKAYKTRMRLYECFGIKIFRRIVLGIEGIKHRRDNSKNVNYHMRDHTVSAMLSLIGYLLYNTVFHIISLIFVIIYFTVAYVMKVRYPMLDVLMSLLVIVNLYCIMLQRYIYVKIQIYMQKQIEIRNKKVKAKVQMLKCAIKNRNFCELQEEYQLIQRLQKHVQEGTDCFLTEMDTPVLRRIATNAKDILRKNKEKTQNDGYKETFTQIVSKIPKYPVVISLVEQRAANLQNVLHLDKRSNALFGFSIITETSECESVYRNIVPDNSRDTVEFMLDVLFEAYRNTLLFQKGLSEMV